MILRVLAGVAVAALLAGLFVGGAQPVAVGLIPAPWDKLAHVAVFAALTLALLLAGGAPLVWRGGWRGLRLLPGRGVLVAGAAVALLAGLADELHQAWSLPGRQAGWDDWLADGLGVVLVVAWAEWSHRRAGLQRVRVRERVRRRKSFWQRYGLRSMAALSVLSALGLYAWLARTDTSDRHLAVKAAPAPKERTAALAPVVLPADHAPHRTPMEWWYYNGHLHGTKGEHFAFHVAIFLHEGAVRHTVFQGTLTDLRTGKRYEQQMRTAGVPTTVLQNGFDFQFQGWRVAGSGADHALQIGDKDFTVTLQMRDAFAPMLHRAEGSATPGLLDFGVGGISYYYSRPRIAATGTVVAGGVRTPVRGDVWFDHQWGDFDGGGLAWNWFALQLDDGTNLMLYELFDAQGRQVMKTGSMAGADGVARPIAADALVLQPQGAWTSGKTGVRYPAAWQIELPLGRLQLTPLRLESEFDARVTTFNIYWEGAVRVSGARTGQGFVELSGYERIKALWPAAGR